MYVLEVFREPFAFGGQESYIMNMFRHMDHEKIHMDFLTPFEARNISCMKEIEAAGGKVYHYDHPFGDNNNRAFRESLEDFLSKNEGKYDAIHFHSGSTYALMTGPKIAASHGIRRRIVHSHSCGFESLKHKMIRKAAAPYFRKYATDFAACSRLAGSWKFPDDIVRDRLSVFYNAVDLDQFHWSPARREELRKEMGVEDRIVIGHIGRFSLQKNHEALIDIFEAFHRRHPDSVLWLIGEGEEEEKIRRKVKDLGLEDAVVFFGLRNDVADLLNAMDLFVLPSFFEGLPVVGIEAQATGLPVVCSDLVAHELPLEDLSFYVSLDAPMDTWSDIMEKALRLERKDTASRMKEQGYEVNEAAARLQRFYLGLLND